MVPATATLTASQASTGSDLPLRVRGSSSEYSIDAFVRRWVVNAHGDGAGAGGGLEPGRDVDRVSDHRVAVADLPRQDLARVDPHPQGEVDSGDPLVYLVHRRLHRKARSHGTLGVVLVGDRRAEHGHDVVADVLVDGPAEPGHLVAETPKGAVDHRLERLRVHALGDGRVAGEVGEQHRRLAPLLGEAFDRGSPRGRRPGQSRPALDAELRAGRVLGSAGGARRRERVAARHAKPGSVGILSPAARAFHPHVLKVTRVGAREA